jgi:hypothetical protein
MQRQNFFSAVTPLRLRGDLAVCFEAFLLAERERGLFGYDLLMNLAKLGVCLLLY